MALNLKEIMTRARLTTEKPSKLVFKCCDTRCGKCSYLQEGRETTPNANMNCK